ncbi:MAG TPA: 3-keto-5-aminohexanoate cleavage protein [Paraburkholderia sp.]
MATNKVIVLVAPTGGMAFKSQNPHLPTQPNEIARDVYDCYNAGASVVAVHARRPDDEATCNADIYRNINELIRAKCDIVINNSTGGGVHGDMVRQIDGAMWDTVWEERLKGMEAGAEMCTLDACTFVASFGGKEVLLNTSPSRCQSLAEEMRKRGIKPEWEVFSPTHIVQDATMLIQMGLDEPPYVFNLVMNAHRGFQNAMPYNPKSLQFMVDLLPEGSIFCVSGIGPAQLPAGVNSLLLGGQIIRVGLEDNLYYRQGQLARNVELVERTVRILREMDYEIATPAEARQMMGLPRNDTSARPYFSVA